MPEEMQKVDSEKRRGEKRMKLAPILTRCFHMHVKEGGVGHLCWPMRAKKRSAVRAKKIKEK